MRPVEERMDGKLVVRQNGKKDSRSDRLMRPGMLISEKVSTVCSDSVIDY